MGFYLGQGGEGTEDPVSVKAKVPKQEAIQKMREAGVQTGHSRGTQFYPPPVSTYSKLQGNFTVTLLQLLIHLYIQPT